MSIVHAACTPIKWPKDSQKYDIYTNEEGIYELLFFKSIAKGKRLQKALLQCDVSQIRQQCTNKLKEDHQQVIEEKDAAIALLSDDLQDCDNQIQAIKYENVALQAQRDVYRAELQKCQDTITHLKKRYVPHAKNPGKDNIVIIVRKHTTPANGKYHNLP